MSSTEQQQQQEAPKWFQRWTKNAPDAEFKPAAGAFHLQHNYGCPFSCRASTARHLLGLDDKIDIANYAPGWDLSNPKDKNDTYTSWVFDPSQAIEGEKNIINDKCPIFGVHSIREVYQLGKPEGAKDFEGDETVPVLIDKRKKQIVSVESGDIVEMFWKEWKDLWSPEAKKWIEENNIDLFPEEGSELQKEMKEALDVYQNGFVFGLYSVGFAESQEEYQTNVKSVYACLDKLEKLLDTRRFVAGNKLTFADLSLAQALVRFDPAYYVNFRFSLKRIRDYKNIRAYMCDIVHLLKMNESSYIPDHIIQIYFGRRNNKDNKEKNAFVPYAPADSEFTQDDLTKHGRDTRKYE